MLMSSYSTVFKASRTTNRLQSSSANAYLANSFFTLLVSYFILVLVQGSGTFLTLSVAVVL